MLFTPLDDLEREDVYFGGLPSELPTLDRPIAVDTETNGLEVDDGDRTCVVSLAWVADDWSIESRAFPFHQDVANHPERNLPRAEWDHLMDWLLATEKHCYWNAPFDLPMLEAGTPQGWPGVDLIGNMRWDGLIAQRGLQPLGVPDPKTGRPQFGLKPVGADLFGPEAAEDAAVLKEALKKLGKGKTRRYDLVDWNILGPYAAQDTVLTIAIACHQWAALTEGEFSWQKLWEEMEVARTLARMERRGIPYNIDRSLEIARNLEGRVAELDKALPFDPHKLQDRIAYFFGEKGDLTSRGVASLHKRAISRTPKGAVQLNQEVVKQLADTGVRNAREYEEWKLGLDMRSKYYQGYAGFCGTDGRLRTRFKQTKVRSGRLSASRVNLQAMPHDHRVRKIIEPGMETPRQLIQAPRGYKLWEMDLAQAELRVAAMYANCAGMLTIIREERDPHGETAIELFADEGVTYDHADFKGIYRQVGKRSNFSLIFGIGPDKFKADIRTQVGLDLPLVQVQRIHKAWNALYPEFRRAIYRHMNMAERDLHTKVRGPVMRWYEELEQKHKAFNQRVQGNLGEFGRSWMLSVERYLATEDLGPHPGAGLLLQIHDSLVLQLPDDDRGAKIAQNCADIAKFDLWPVWFPDVPGDVDMKPWSKD